MAVLSAIFLYPVPALFAGSAAIRLGVCCAHAALQSEESDGEEQERAMFRALAQSRATAVSGAGGSEVAEPVRFPQMPDLARLQAALSAEATPAPVEPAAEPIARDSA